MRTFAILIHCWLLGAAGLVGKEAAQAEFAKQDRALNEVYQKLKKELPEAVFNVVREDQRAWVEYRDHISEWQKGYEEMSDEQARLEMAASLTESRVEWLRAWQTKQSGDWEGEYRDSYGGYLQVVKEKGEYYFLLQVVRGPSFHLGHLAGKLRVNGSTAWFETQADGAEEATWLTFVPTGDASSRVRVVSENAQYFHGARAYFDGEYLRLGEVSAKDRAQVIKGDFE